MARPVVLAAVLASVLAMLMPISVEAAPPDDQSIVKRYARSAYKEALRLLRRERRPEPRLYQHFHDYPEARLYRDLRDYPPGCVYREPADYRFTCREMHRLGRDRNW